MLKLSLLLLFLQACYAAECQPRLDAWCNNVNNPAIAQCYAAVKAHGATVPLYARLDTDAQHGPNQWRCYSAASLSPDLSHYTNGTAYCTHESDLLGVLAECHADTQFSTLFPFNTSGVHSYRIPVMLAVPVPGQSTARLLAFAEARILSASDDGPKHLSLRTSDDGGVQWSPIRNLVTDSPIEPGVDGLNLGSATYDAKRGVIHVHYLTAGHSLPVARAWTMTSKDFGATWSTPRNITSTFVNAGIHLFAPGPGTGVQLGSGRLAVSGWYRDASGVLGSLVLYSDDGGTWVVGGRLPANSTGDLPYQPNECQVAALPNNVLVINARDGAGDGCRCRLVATSTDGGESFGAVEQVTALPDPICQGSMIAANPKTLLLSNADSSVARENGTFHVSFDGGRSWAYAGLIDPASFAYSGLAMLNSSAVAVVWEHNSDDFATIRFSVRGFRGAAE